MVRGIIWENAEEHLKWLKNNMVVRIRGEATRYNDEPQIAINSINQEDDFNPSDFVPDMGEERRTEILNRLQGMHTTVYAESDPECVYRKIWDYIVMNKPKNSIHEYFIECPGGTGEVHHAYLGGLMEHTTGMCVAAETLPHHPLISNIYRPLLMVGCVVHDIGKIDSYNWDIVIEMNDQGRLLHHITLGLETLNEIARNLSINTEGEEITRLKHIILTHHEMESPRKPMFPEAVAVSMLDNLDAAVNHSVGYTMNPENHEEDGNWTRFNRLTERRYYVPQTSGNDNLPVPEPKQEEDTDNAC
jgi:3'-5' exoribonuclease